MTTTTTTMVLLKMTAPPTCERRPRAQTMALTVSAAAAAGVATTMTKTKFRRTTRGRKRCSAPRTSEHAASLGGARRTDDVRASLVPAASHLVCTFLLISLYLLAGNVCADHLTSGALCIILYVLLTVSSATPQHPRIICLTLRPVHRFLHARAVPIWFPSQSAYSRCLARPVA